ncbi:MAG: apolipoprotein N-acyltransferase [Roseibium sp.]
MHSFFQRLTVLPNAFLLSWGWRRRILCILCGAVSALSLPPFGLFLVLFLTIPGFVWILDGAIETTQSSYGRRAWTGFLLGWFFGFGYFLAGLWWIGAAFLVEADKFAWLMPFAVIAMPIGLALFTGAGVAVAAALWTDHRYRIVLFAAALAMADWLRSNVLTGFPWNSFGYAVSENLVLSQTASLFGLYGLSFLVLSTCAAPAVLADARPMKQRLMVVVLAAGVLAAMCVFGTIRLWATENFFADLDIRIVQPAINQHDKWRPELREEIFQTYLDMTEAPLGGSARIGMPRLVVWPESAVPFLLSQEPGALTRVGQALGAKTELTTGAIRAEARAESPQYFNSIFMIGNDGVVTGVYDKVRLVPFGEFVPFLDVLKKIGVTNIAGPINGFASGFSRRPIETAGSFSFLPLICYEIIFPGILGSNSDRPSFLLNVTNDAWFGRTPGPYQHFAQARMRSIETGVPLIRAANTGVSAIVDGYGQVVQKLPVFERGIIDGNLPQRIDRTVYSRIGDVIFLIISMFTVIFSAIFRRNCVSRVN